MTSPPSGRSRGGRPWPPVLLSRPVLLIAVGVGLSVAASFTRPFTIAADALVAAVLGVAVVGFGLRLRAPAPEPKAAEARLRFWPWLVATGAVVAWELATYLQMPRSAHPTLSSMLDSADSHPIGKAFVFGAWLLLGVAVVRR